jgi:hypothetical protein
MKPMKLIQTLIVALVLVCSLAIAQPSWANKPPVTSNPDYIAVTEELTTATDPVEIAKLQFEKYIIETGDSFSECRNLTANPLIVYGKKSKSDASTFDNALYTLPAGGTTNEDWNCQGVYLINGLNNDGVPVAARIVTGTQLVAKANPETGAVELNIPVAKIFKQGEVNWNIPESAEVLTALQIPQAPLD